MAPSPSGSEPLAELRSRLRLVYRANGEPSTREVARRTGHAISHTTVHLVLRGEKTPRWGQLELVVEALGGDVDEFRQLWVAVRNAEDRAPAPAGAPRSGQLPTADTEKARRVAVWPGISAEGAARAEFRELRAARRHISNVLASEDAIVSIASAGLVQCPICLRRIDWGEVRETLYVWSENQCEYLPVSRNTGESAQHWRQRVAGAFVRCSTDSREFNEHYLPTLYGAYGDPIVIPAVGRTYSGKTTLLTMIGAELERGVTLNGELSFRPLDHGMGELFHNGYVRPLLQERRADPGTSGGRRSFFHAWRGYNHRTGRLFVLAFFDTAGGDFVSESRMPLFIGAASAFLFLVDADVIGHEVGDPATDNVIDLLGVGQLDALPAATVITKSDLLQQRPEVLRWLSRDDETDLTTIEQESEDAYAFLSVNAGPGWLRPAREIPSTTLHFASAAGTRVDPDTLLFEEDHFGPRRVLRPLLSLLRAIGVIEKSQFAPDRDSR